MKKFTSEELLQMVTKAINGNKDNNFTRTFDVIWEDIDGLFSDSSTKQEKETILKNTLQLYGQMVVLESVNLTLEALERTGTLGSIDHSND